MSYLSHDTPPPPKLRTESFIFYPLLNYIILFHFFCSYFGRLFIHLFIKSIRKFTVLSFVCFFVFWLVEIVDSYGLLLYPLKLSNENIQNKMIWGWDLVECADIIFMVHLILFIHRVRLHSTDFLGRTVVGQRNWGCDLCAL